MTASQQRVLAALARKPKMTLAGVASAVDGRVPHVQHTLDSLFRRSLVTVDSGSQWLLTDRGRKKAAA